MEIEKIYPNVAEHMNYRILKNNLHRPCPICFNRTVEILHTQKFVIPEGYPLPEIYDVVCCIKCGFVYADTSARQEDYDLYYQNFSKYEDPVISTGSGNTALDKERCEGVAAEVTRFIPDTQSSIIDIGCANGGVLSALQNMGYKELTGLDPSRACINYIKQRYNISRAIVGGIFSQNDELVQEKFDCAILSGVIEHIYNIKQAILNIRNLLKTDGILYLEAPDASHYSDHDVVPYYYFDSEHINHFDKYSLKNLLTLNNFDCISYIEKETRVSKSNVFSVVSIIGKKRPINNYNEIEPIPDYTVRNSILKHVKTSELNEDSINIKLKPLIDSKYPVIIWGAGNFTMRLLKGSILKNCNIIALIDNDSGKWGKILYGIPVYSPDKLKELKGTIIICSALYSEDIYLQIKSMEISNKVVVLKQSH